MTWHFILAKRQIRYVLNISSKLIKHGTQNPVCKIQDVSIQFTLLLTCSILIFKTINSCFNTLIKHVIL